jgi:hypothetical protein
LVLVLLVLLSSFGDYRSRILGCSPVAVFPLWVMILAVSDLCFLRWDYLADFCRLCDWVLLLCSVRMGRTIFDCVFRWALSYSSCLLFYMFVLVLL